MKIFGGFVSALNPNGTFQATPVTLNAENEDEALECLHTYSRKIVYTVKQSYTQHQEAVIVVTDVQIEAVK